MSAAALLEAVDPAWCGVADAGLMRLARDSRLGRRLLLDRLQAHAPTLIGEGFLRRLARGEPALPPAWSAENIGGFAAALGAVSLAPGIRSLIRRADVAAARETLGEALYALALDASLWSAKLPGRERRRLEMRLRGLLSDIAATRQYLGLRAQTELSAYAASVPPLHERVRLLRAPAFVSEGESGWLPHEVRIAIAQRYGLGPEEIRRDYGTPD